VSRKRSKTPGAYRNNQRSYTVKKILCIAILAGAAYFGYKKFVA